MGRRTVWAAAGVLGLALAAAPGSTSYASGETCRGEAATIVGTESVVTGTEGRDVIVTQFADTVRTLGGDDIVCVVPRGLRTNVVDVDAGSGNDVVDTSSGQLSGFYTEVDLGPGADVFEGGPAGDSVDTGDEPGSTAEVDVVRAGAERDVVTTSGGSDVIDLGVDDDYLLLHGDRTAPDGILAGGEGRDTLTMSVSGTDGDVFDMAAGVYQTPGAMARFSSFERLDLDARDAHIAYTGTSGDDHLWVDFVDSSPSTLTADLLGGDDGVVLGAISFGPGSRIDTGAGDDEVVAARGTDGLALDLPREQLLIGDHTYPASGVENAFLMAPQVSLVGDAQDNSLYALACTTSIAGGRGDDTLFHRGDQVFEGYAFSCPPSATMRGGPGQDEIGGTGGDDRLFGDGGRDTILGWGGDDRVSGGPGADTLKGGSGRDVLVGEGGRDLANGGTSRDRCVAERKRSCER
jgi:Ca2+-binding RTX toxin-like protein